MTDSWGRNRKQILKILLWSMLVNSLGTRLFSWHSLILGFMHIVLLLNYDVPNFVESRDCMIFGCSANNKTIRVSIQDNGVALECRQKSRPQSNQNSEEQRRTGVERNSTSHNCQTVSLLQSFVDLVFNSQQQSRWSDVFERTGNLLQQCNSEWVFLHWKVANNIRCEETVYGQDQDTFRSRPSSPAPYGQSSSTQSLG